MRPALAVLVLALALPTSLASAGCATTATGEDGATAAAQSANAEYEEAVAAASPRVTTKGAPTDPYSAETRLLGFIPNRAVDAVATQLMDLGRWTEIKNGDNASFASASATSDDHAAPRRTVAGRLEILSGVSLDMRLTSTTTEAGASVLVTNTSGYRHWLLGMLLESGRLRIAVDLIPYKDGVIVDATMRVKLASHEDRGPAVTGVIAPIFAWLKG